MWSVEFVVCSRPCSEGFSAGSPVFLPPQKPTLPNSNSIWNIQALYHEPLAQVIAQALPVFDIKFAFKFTLFPENLILISNSKIPSPVVYCFDGRDRLPLI